MSGEDLRFLQESLGALIRTEDWPGILRLRSIYSDMMARDTISAHAVTQKLSQMAIGSARRLGYERELAHLLGAYGHNLHRQGYHQKALDAFREASQLYSELGDDWESLKNYYMTALCHRGLGQIPAAVRILQNVLGSLDKSDPWRGQPLQVLAWTHRDRGNFAIAEELFTESLRLQRTSGSSDILVAGTLADLGELRGMQGRIDDGILLLEESLQVLSSHQGQYVRQEARSEAKLASLLMKAGRHDEAMGLLNDADDIVRQSAYYDEIWKIELLKSLSYLRRFRFLSARRKLISSWRIFQQLGSSWTDFARQIVRRLPAVVHTPILQRVLNALVDRFLEYISRGET